MADSGSFITSTDGTKIWAEFLGAVDKPCIVWIHGLSCSALPFDKQFADEEFLKVYKMVCLPNSVLLLFLLSLCFGLIKLTRTWMGTLVTRRRCI